VNLVDPRGLEKREWVDYTADNLSAYLRVMKIESGDQWKEWGSYARQTLFRRGIVVPDPTQFEDFEEWASRFNQIISPLQSRP